MVHKEHYNGAIMHNNGAYKLLQLYNSVHFSTQLYTYKLTL